MNLERSVWLEFQSPAVFVDSVVVPGTQWDEIVEVGGPAVFPFLDVVCLAPGDGPVASVPGAAAVEGVEGGPLRCGGGA